MTKKCEFKESLCHEKELIHRYLPYRTTTQKVIMAGVRLRFELGSSDIQVWDVTNRRFVVKDVSK